MPTKTKIAQTSRWARSGRFWTLEVKAAIFSELHLDSITLSAPPIFSRSHPSVVVSHVCKQWRDAALSQPALWTDVKVVLPDCALPSKAYISQIQALEESLAVWLERSKALRIRVTLGNVNREDVVAAATGKGGKKRLIAFDHLWATLTRSTPRWAELLSPGRADQGQWVLDALRVQNQDPKLDLAPPHTSNITSLKVGKRGPGKALLSSPFAGMDKQACHNMQHLELYGAQTENLDDVLDLLAKCPNLVTLVLERRLQLWGPYTGKHTGEKRVTLSNLEALTFKESPPVPDFDTAFILPSLQRFTFCDMTESSLEVLQGPRRVRFPAESEGSLRKWMAGLGRSLAALSLVNNFLYPRADWMFRCLKDDLLPNLTELTLLGRCDTDLLFDRWLANGSCPKLKRFICVPDSYENAWMTERAVVNFLRDRLGVARKGLSKLTYVSVGVRADKRPSDVKGSLTLKPADPDALKGVVIEITYIPPRPVTLVLNDGNLRLNY